MEVFNEFKRIIREAKIDSGIVFLVKDKKGRTHEVPVNGIGVCIESLKKKSQELILEHCRRLKDQPKKLINFLKKLAKTVVGRKF